MSEHLAITATLGGRKRKFLQSMKALMIAQEVHGWQADADKNPTRAALEELWLGLLHYEPDLTFDDFAGQLHVQDSRAVQDVFVKLQAVQAGAPPDDGKKKAGKPKRATAKASPASET